MPRVPGLKTLRARTGRPAFGSGRRPSRQALAQHDRKGQPVNRFTYQMPGSASRRSRLSEILSIARSFPCSAVDHSYIGSIPSGYVRCLTSHIPGGSQDRLDHFSSGNRCARAEPLRCAWFPCRYCGSGCGYTGYYFCSSWRRFSRCPHIFRRSCMNDPGARSCARHVKDRFKFAKP